MATDKELLEMSESEYKDYTDDLVKSRKQEIKQLKAKKRIEIVRHEDRYGVRPTLTYNKEEIERKVANIGKELTKAKKKKKLLSLKKKKNIYEQLQKGLAKQKQATELNKIKLLRQVIGKKEAQPSNILNAPNPFFRR